MPCLDHFSLLAPLYERFIRPYYPENLIRLVQLPINGAILDAGGGTGRLAQYLAGDERLVVIADETYQMTLEAHKKGLPAVCGQAEHLPFPDGFFQRIIMVDALHHVNHQRGSLQELWRVLSPDGLMVIEEPDIDFFVVKLIALAEKIALMRSHFLSSSKIKSMCNFPDAEVSGESHNGMTWITVKKKPLVGNLV